MHETSPRAVLAERFALLYAEAGNPPLKQVTAWVARARVVDERGVAIRVSAQRVSDWRRGRNVPARFIVLAVVLRMLIESARRTRADPKVAGLYDLRTWQALWEAASTSPLVDIDRPHGEWATENADTCPYQGLAVFDRANAPLFFGRDRATTALLELLAKASRTGGIVALVGASGSGKSSLLRAGLVPALAAGRLPVAGSTGWPVVLMPPGPDPVTELIGQISSLATVLAAPDWTPTAVRSACARHAGPGARLVLIVDQFEEILTLCPDQGRRRLFVSILHAACTLPEPGAVVVLGLRADFYDRFLEHPELAGALQDRQLVLGPMTTAELREVIARPAKAVGLRPENGLVELLLRDLAGGPSRSAYAAGALPLLSHALLATWQRRAAGKLTIAGYRATGGIHGAVAATAELAWAELDPNGRTAARRLLLRLVRIGEDGQDTRRRVSHDDARSNAVALEVLTHHRLVTLDAGTVEITHEALLRAWPRLRRWLDDGRAGHLSRQRIEEDAATWVRQDRDTSLLYRGARLLLVERQAAAGTADLTGAAEDFLAASVRHRRHTSWARRAAVAAVVVFALVAATMAVVAIRQRDDAVYRQALAEADRLLATDPSLSAQLSLVAHRMRPDDKGGHTRLVSTVNTALATPLVGHRGAVYLTSFSPDGHTLATASYDHTVRLWDVRDRSRPVPLGKPLTGHTSWVSSAVFSSDGRLLATAGNDRTVRLWDVRDPDETVPVGDPITSHHGTIYLVAFSPDGRTLATANEDHTARLWDVRDSAHPRPIGEPLAGHSAAVRSVAFSPDGRTLATAGDDRTVRLWNLTGAAGPVLTGHTATVHSVAFSPDGRTLATAGSDRTIRLWNLTDPAAVTAAGLPLTGHNGPVWSVKFSPDGTLLASGGQDGTARLWDLTEQADPRQLGQPMTGGTGTVFAVDFSPDGHALATGSLDSLVRLWSLPTTVLVGPTSGAVPPAFRADGRLLATGAVDGIVQLWNTTDLAHARPAGPPLTGHSGPVWSARFSPDGDVLATGSGDRTVRLWDVRHPATTVPLGDPIALRNRYVAPLAFSPDGWILATASEDTTVQLWDVRDPAAPNALGPPLGGHTEYVNSLAFSPDGRVLATASSDRSLRLWKVTNPERPEPLGRPISTHDGPVLQATFSPDGRVLATASEDTTVQLWDVRDPAAPNALGPPLGGHTEYVNSLAFSPDGRVLATASSDRSLRLWNVTDPERPEPLGQPISTPSDSGHSLTFSPTGNYLATTSDDALHLWNLDVDHAIQRICDTTRDALDAELWHRHLPEISYEPPCP